MKALIVNIYWIFKSYREQSKKKYIWNNWIVWVLLTLLWTFLIDSTEGGRDIFFNEKKSQHSRPERFIGFVSLYLSFYYLFVQLILSQELNV